MNKVTGKSKVVIISAPSYEESLLENKIIEGFRFFGGIRRFIKQGDRVFIKPNFIRAPRHHYDPQITNPALLYILCRILKDAGAKLVIGDSPAFGTVRGILRKCGYESRFKNLDVNVITLRRSVRVNRIVAGIEKSFLLSKEVVESDFIINVPKLKVHGQMGMTMAIKNIFGCVPGKRKAWRHMSYGDYGDGFARMIAETFAAVAPGFTILDGIVAMQRHGPTGGDPAQIELLLFSDDALAIERIIAEILDINPEKLPIFRAAAAIGIGESKLENIEIIGEQLDKIGKKHLIPARLGPIRFSLPRVIKSTIRNILISYFRKQQ